ncbi:MAG TPA: hypothetical protein ENK77_02120 [Epsilonproteobacteria bacterium]|nr:hypothetical protein [Campylobacterota bacterium]
MKKIFPLQHPKKKPERIVEAIKHEVRKYTQRERRKTLPDAEKMYWDFECQFGETSTSAESVHFSGIIEGLDKVAAAGWDSCYIEIIAKAVDKPLSKSSLDTSVSSETEE